MAIPYNLSRPNYQYDNPSILTPEQKEFIKKLDKLADFYIDYFGKEFEDIIRKRLKECVTVFVEQEQAPISADLGKIMDDKLMEKFCSTVHLKNIGLSAKDFDNSCKTILQCDFANVKQRLAQNDYQSALKNVFQVFGYGRIYKNVDELAENLKTSDGFEEFKIKIGSFYEKFRLEYLPISQAPYFPAKRNRLALEQIGYHVEETQQSSFDKLLHSDLGNLSEDEISLFDALLPTLKNMFKDVDGVDFKDINSVLSSPAIINRLKNLQKFIKRIDANYEIIYNDTVSELGTEEDHFREFTKFGAQLTGKPSYSEKSMDSPLFLLDALHKKRTSGFVDFHNNLTNCYIDPSLPSVIQVHEFIHVISAIGDDRLGLKVTPSAPGNITRRRYEQLLNEALTQYFAIQVDTRMKKAGLHMGSDKKFVSGYDQTVELLSPFIKQYEDIFKRAYMNNSYDEIIDLIGEKNLELLFEIVSQIMSHKLSDYEMEYWRFLQKNKNARLLDESKSTNIQYINLFKKVMDNCIYPYINEHRAAASR